MENPFNSVTRMRRERRLIEQGIYQGTLQEVKSVQVNDKKTNEKKTKIVFSYQIPQEDTEIPVWFNPSLNDNSWIVKFLRSSCGSLFTQEIQSSPEKMWEFCQSLVGKEFTLIVALNDGFNNVSSALLAKQKPATAIDNQGAVFSDDDIPF